MFSKQFVRNGPRVLACVWEDLRCLLHCSELVKGEKMQIHIYCGMYIVVLK